MRLILHNLKKGKRQFISFVIMILITAMITHIALVLNSQTGKAYDRLFEELGTAEINMLIPKAFANGEIENDLQALDGVKATESHDGIFLTTTVHEFSGTDFDMNTVFYRADEKRTLDRLDIDGKIENKKDIIYVPQYIGSLGGFGVGGKITYRIDGEDITFTIGGIVSEMQYGNYGTGLIGAYLPQAAYDEFTEKFNDKCVVEYAIKTDADADVAALKKGITSLFGEKNIPVANIGDRDTAKQTRTMVCNLLIMIFLALAAIILLVSLFLSCFRIRNSMEDEMTSMGVLKAMGYTSGGIMTSVVTPYAFVGWLSALCGVMLSFALLPPVASFLAMQSGFSYTPEFDLGVFLLSEWLPTLLIIVFSVYSARKIRRLEPIWAIRGITDDKSGKNIFPLEESALGAKASLVLKQIFSSPAQNILLFVLSFGIMILLSFAGTLFYNVNIKPNNFMNTLSEESPSVIFTAKPGKIDELKDVLESRVDVERVIKYATINAGHEDGSLKCFVCEDFSLVLNNICYSGKDPTSSDEIALGSALEDKYPIGSTVKITIGEKSHTYTVTGYVQSINNSGNVCELTEEGYKKISDASLSSLNIYLEKGRSADFIKECEDEYGELISSSLDYERLAESGQKLYAGIVSAVTALLLVISALVVLLVMYIMIGSMITRRRREFGIYKAIGWSDRQLLTQSAMCFVPVIALSALISVPAGMLYMPAINNAIFGMLGAMKNNFEVPAWFLLIFALLLVVIAYVICVMLSKPIKKITAYSLLKE